jgi:hypothetical protein
MLDCAMLGNFFQKIFQCFGLPFPVTGAAEVLAVKNL